MIQISLKAVKGEIKHSTGDYTDSYRYLRADNSFQSGGCSFEDTPEHDPGIRAAFHR